VAAASVARARATIGQALTGPGVEPPSRLLNSTPVGEPGVGVAVGVAVGGMGVSVAVAVGVAVGGTGVSVGVAVGGTGVSVAVGVAVGGTGVSVGVAVGGTGVLVGVAVGGAPQVRLSVTEATVPVSAAALSEAQNCQVPLLARPAKPAKLASEPLKPSGLGLYEQRPSSRQTTPFVSMVLPMLSAGSLLASVNRIG